MNNNYNTQNNKLGNIATFLAFATIAVLVIYPVQDFDIFWHIANGRAMLEQGKIINQEIFSYTANGKHFNNHAWLAQILFFLSYKGLGANGLIALKLLLTMVISATIYRTGKRHGLSPSPAATICLLAIGASLFRYVARPHLFSYICLAYLAALLYNSRTSKKAQHLIFIIPPLMLLWDTLHGAIYGVIFIAAFAGAESMKMTIRRYTDKIAWINPMPKTNFKLMWIAIGLTTALMLISPYGLRTYDVFIQFVSGTNIMTSMTAEFKPTDLGSQPLFIALFILTILTVLSAGRKLDITNLAVIIPFGWLAIRYVRGIGPFSIVAAIIIAVNLPLLLAKLQNQDKVQKSTVIISTILIISGAIFGVYHKFAPPLKYDTFGIGLSHDAFPTGSTNFIKGAELTGNMYNTDRYGGYLAFFLYPERKIFHYNHHMLFTALENFVHKPESRQQWQINYALVGRADEWDMFSKDGFVPIYWEPTGAVMIKDIPQNQKIIKRYHIRYFSPLMTTDEFMRQSANSFILPTLLRETSDYLQYREDLPRAANLAKALATTSIISINDKIKTATNAWQANNKSPDLAELLGKLHYKNDNMIQAIVFLESAVSLDSGRAGAIFSLAYAQYDLKQYDKAIINFQKILRKNPSHPDSLYGLALSYYQLRNYAMAKENWLQYLTLIPNGLWADKARNYIDNLPVD